ncbi:copper resistance CopC/CopD family protein [Streptomyces sp. 7N604]|uniref:copper resistance CopC/CopD family protein n=1 Tax=Streptomyces sp. 7N604 TaxID=3457415 RepID=UPI003FD121D4
MPLTTTPRRGHRAGGVLVMLCAVFGLVAWVLAGSASAHAKVRATEPAQDAVLTNPPRQVSITFTEPMTLSDDSIRVFAPDGRRVDTGTTGHLAGDRATARVALGRDLPKGTFTVSWKATSADGHPIGEAFVFSVGKPSPSSVELPDASPGKGVAGTLYDISRYVSCAGYALLVGTSAFLLLCRPRRAARHALRRLLQTGWSALLLSTIALLMLHAPYISGNGLGEAVDLSAIRNTLDTRQGTALVTRLLLLPGAIAFLAVLAATSPRQAAENAADQHSDTTVGPSDGVGAPDAAPPGPRRALTGAGALLAATLAGTWSAAGHASTGIQVALAVPVDALHLLAMAVWLGGLAAMLTLMFRAPAAAGLGADIVSRFSRMAFAAVVILAVTGVYQSWRLIGSWDALLSTAYGTLLLVKVVGVGAMLAAAAYSRRWTAQLRPVRPQSTPHVSRQESERTLEPVAATASSPSSNADRGPGPARQTAELSDTVASTAGDHDRASLQRRLRRSVGVETVIAVAVLAVTVWLTSTEPGRPATQNAAAPGTGTPGAPPAGGFGLVTFTVPFDTGAADDTGKGKVTVNLSPGRTGRNDLQALAHGPDGGITTVPEMRITFTNTTKNIGPLDAKVKNVGGYWEAGDLQLPTAGDWEVAVTVRTSEIDQATETKTVKIG